MVRQDSTQPVWCHPASAQSACKPQEYPKVRSPLPVHSYGEKCCIPNLPVCPAPGPEVQGHNSSCCSELSALGLHVWHTREVAAGWPRGFHSSGKSGSRSCWKTRVWLCRNEPVLESLFLREGLFCPCKRWCAQSITEHCFRRANPGHGWWHVQAMAHAGTGRHTEEIYWHSEPHPPLLSHTGGEGGASR